MTDKRASDGEIHTGENDSVKTIRWDFQHWGDPEDYEGYDPEATYVHTLDTGLLDSVRDAFLAAQQRGEIQNLQSHYDDRLHATLDQDVQQGIDSPDDGWNVSP